MNGRSPGMDGFSLNRSGGSAPTRHAQPEPGLPIDLGALTTALDTLVDDGTLSVGQVRDILRRLAVPVPAKRPRPLQPALPSPPGSTSQAGEATGPAEGVAFAPGVGDRLVPGLSGPRARPGNPASVGTTGRRDVSGPDGPVMPGHRPHGGAHRTWPALLAEVGGYLGVLLVLGGGFALTRSGWQTLTPTDRLVLLAGPAAALVLAGWAVLATQPAGGMTSPRGGVPARHRLGAVMISLAAVLSGGAVSQLARGGQQALAGSGGTLLVAVIGYLACRSPVLHLTTAAATGVALGHVFAALGDSGGAIAWGLLLTGTSWTALALGGWLTEGRLGALVGGGLVYAGAEWLALGGRPGAGYFALFVMAAGWLAGYLWSRTASALVVAVVALATALPQAVTHYLGGTLHVSGILLVAGWSIVAASVLVLLLYRRAPTHRAG